jgi:hypothetical protein
MRPPAESESGEELFVERAHAAAALGPLGHHTHFTAPDHARPVADGAAERVLAEGAWFREHGLAPTLFCGGGWYMDASVAAAAAALGYADCSATSFRPKYLPRGAARLSLTAPAWLELDGGSRLLELPTTHSVGMLARAVASLQGPAGPVVHAYFHDTDLLDRRRAAAIWAGLGLLGLRRRQSDLDRVAAEEGDRAPVVPFEQAAAVE